MCSRFSIVITVCFVLQWGMHNALTWDHLWLTTQSVLQEPAKHDSVDGGFGLCLQKLSFTEVFLVSTQVTILCLTPF